MTSRQPLLTGQPLMVVVLLFMAAFLQLLALSSHSLVLASPSAPALVQAASPLPPPIVAAPAPAMQPPAAPYNDAGAAPAAPAAPAAASVVSPAASTASPAASTASPASPDTASPRKNPRRHQLFADLLLRVQAEAEAEVQAAAPAATPAADGAHELLRRQKRQQLFADLLQHVQAEAAALEPVPDPAVPDAAVAATASTDAAVQGSDHQKRRQLFADLLQQAQAEVAAPAPAAASADGGAHVKRQHRQQLFAELAQQVKQHQTAATLEHGKGGMASAVVAATAPGAIHLPPSAASSAAAAAAAVGMAVGMAVAAELGLPGYAANNMRPRLPRVLMGNSVASAVAAAASAASGLAGSAVSDPSASSAASLLQQQLAAQKQDRSKPPSMLQRMRMPSGPVIAPETETILSKYLFVSLFLASIAWLLVSSQKRGPKSQQRPTALAVLVVLSKLPVILFAILTASLSGFASLMSRGFWAILYPNGLPRSRRSSDGTASRSSKSARRKRPLGSSAASPIAGGGSTRDAVARLRQTSVSAAKLLFNLQSDSDDSSDDYASDSSAQHRRHARRLSRAFSDLDSGMLTDGASSMADSVSSPTSPSSTVHGRSSRPTHSRSKSLSSSAAIHQPQQPHPQQQQHQQHPVLRRLPKDQQQDQQQLEQLDILQQQEKSAQPQRSAPTQRQPSQPSQNQHQKQQPQQQQQPPEIRLPRRHARSTSQVSLNAQDAPTASHHEPSPVHGRRNPLVSDKPAPADASMPQSALSALLSTSAASESSADTLTVPQAPRGLHARSRSFSSQSTLSSSPRASPHSSPLVTPKAGVDVSAASSSAADSRSSPRLTATRRMSNAPHPSRSPLTLPLALPPAVPITRVPSSSATSAAFPPSSSPPLVFSSLALPATPPSVSAWSSPLNLGNLSNHSPSHTRDTGNSSDSDRSIDHHRNAQQLQQVGKKGKQQAGSKTRKPVAAPNSHGNVSDDQTLSSPNASSQSQSRPASALRERHLSASQRLSGAGAGSSQTHSPSDVESANADVSIIIKAKSPAPRSGVQDQAVVGGVGGAGGGSGGTGAGATAKPAAQQSSAKNGKTATLPSQAATASSVTRTGHSSANPPEPLGEMPGSYPIRRTPSNGVSTSSSSSSSSSIGGRSGNNSPSSMASYTMQLRGVQQSEPPKSPSPTRLHRPSAPPGISIRTDLDSIHAKSGPSRMAGHDNGNKKSTGSAGYTPSATTATMAATAAATASAAAAYRLDRDLDGMDADFHSTHAGAGIPRSPASASAPHHHRRVRSALVFSPIAAPTSTPATTVASSALGAQSHLGFSGPPPPGIRHPLQSQYQQRQSLQQQQQQQLEQQQLELQRYYQRQLQYQEEQYQMHLAAQKRAAEHSMVDNLFSPSALLSSSLMSARDSYNSLFESLLQPVPPPQSTTPPVPSPAPPGLAASPSLLPPKSHAHDLGSDLSPLRDHDVYEHGAFQRPKHHQQHHQQQYYSVFSGLDYADDPFNPFGSMADPIETRRGSVSNNHGSNANGVIGFPRRPSHAQTHAPQMQQMFGQPDLSGRRGSTLDILSYGLQGHSHGSNAPVGSGIPERLQQHGAHGPHPTYVMDGAHGLGKGLATADGRQGAVLRKRVSSSSMSSIGTASSASSSTNSNSSDVGGSSGSSSSHGRVDDDRLEYDELDDDGRERGGMSLGSFKRLLNAPSLFDVWK